MQKKNYLDIKQANTMGKSDRNDVEVHQRISTEFSTFHQNYFELYT